MPRRNRTGARCAESMAGRGLGFCANKNAIRYGIGLGLTHRRGFGYGLGRRLAINQNSAKINKDLLQYQKELLQNRLEVIDKQLEGL